MTDPIQQIEERFKKFHYSTKLNDIDMGAMQTDIQNLLKLVKAYELHLKVNTTVKNATLIRKEIDQIKQEIFGEK